MQNFFSVFMYGEVNVLDPSSGKYDLKLGENLLTTSIFQQDLSWLGALYVCKLLGIVEDWILYSQGAS